MKQLNLLPESVRFKEVQSQFYTGGAIAAVIAVITVGLIWGAVNTLAISVTGQLKAVQADNTPEKVVTPVADAATIQRITILNTLAKSDTDWPVTFQLVGDLVAKDITLSSYALTKTANGMDLVMVGSAPSNVSFATFAEAFQGNSLLTGAKVTGYNYDPSKDTVTFTVEGIILPSKVAYSK